MIAAIGQHVCGVDQQLKMAPLGTSRKYLKGKYDARKAAVLILLYQKEDEWHTILIKRTSRKGDVHSGQIGLPGGRQDPEETIETCALRECHEEIGVLPDSVTAIGMLTELYVYASHHTIYPFIGVLDTPPEIIPCPDEVAGVYEIALRAFDTDNILKQDMVIRGMEIKDVPYYNIEGEVLWGATAMIMSEFLYLWNKCKRSI